MPILFGEMKKRDDGWVLVGGNAPGGEIQVDVTDVRPLEAPTTVVSFEDEVRDDALVSVTGNFDDAGQQSVIIARGIVGHDAIRRLANEMSLTQQASSESANSFARRSELRDWLSAERQLLGLNLALWWGNVSMTTDFLVMSSGNVPGQTAAIYGRLFSEVDAFGELVSAVGRIGQKVRFFNEGTSKEFFLLVEHIVTHDRISELAHQFHASGRDTQLSNWLRAERELLLRLI